MTRRLIVTAALFFATIFSPSTVLGNDLQASGSGWCINNRWCNSNSPIGINNHVAWASEPHQNWFSFQLPKWQFTSASINIWNEIEYTFPSVATYQVFETGDVIIGYDDPDLPDIDFDNGMPLGQIQFSELSRRYYSVPLSADGLSALNSRRGRLIIFGGVIDRYLFAGSTDGYPAAFLSYEGAPSVPEPSTWMMLIFGFALAGYSLRSGSRGRKNLRQTRELGN